MAMKVCSVVIFASVDGMLQLIILEGEAVSEEYEVG